ncbi:MAG TPA: hypothetical protein VJB06_04555, partial [archaeon]|nr:hypothetical protein [archaeon]
YISEKGEKEYSADKLLFRDNKFISQTYEDQGYLPTNYSATAEPDGSTKFGTMQLKGKETSFWKGVVSGETIDGSVHVQFAKGTNRTTYFNGKLVSGVLVKKGEKKPEPVLPPSPPSQPVVSNPPAEPASPEAPEVPANTVEQAVEQVIPVPVVEVSEPVSEESDVVGQVPEIIENTGATDAIKPKPKKKRWF